MNSQDQSSNQALLSAMRDSLKKQTQLCKGFLCLLQEERNALMTLDIEALMRFSRKKEELLDHIHQLDDTVRQDTALIAAAHNGAAETLTGLIPLLPREEAGAFDSFRKQLGKLREEISSRNMLNKRFCEETLSCINEAINLITGHDQQVSYNAPGATSFSNQPPALLNREA